MTAQRLYGRASDEWTLIAMRRESIERIAREELCGADDLKVTIVGYEGKGATASYHIPSVLLRTTEVRGMASLKKRIREELGYVSFDNQTAFFPQDLIRYTAPGLQVRPPYIVRNH